MGLIGAASVATMLAVGSSATLEVQEDLSRLGSNLPTVIPGQFRFCGARMEAQPFSPEDVEAIRNQVLGIKDLVPVSRRGVKACTGTGTGKLHA